MECESHILVIKPLVFMYTVTDLQTRDSRGCQVEELKDGIILLQVLICQTKAPGTARLERKSLEVKVRGSFLHLISLFISLFHPVFIQTHPTFPGTSVSHNFRRDQVRKMTLSESFK